MLPNFKACETIQPPPPPPKSCARCDIIFTFFHKTDPEKCSQLSKKCPKCSNFPPKQSSQTCKSENIECLTEKYEKMTKIDFFLYVTTSTGFWGVFEGGCWIVSVNTVWGIKIKIKSRPKLYILAKLFEVCLFSWI